MSGLSNIDPKQFVEWTQATQSRSEAFCARLDLNYFQFLRVYEDGGILPLVSQHDWLQRSVEHAEKLGQFSFSSLKQEQLDAETFIFSWQDNLPIAALQFAAEFGVYEGLTVVERRERSYDMIAFGRPAGQSGSLDFYCRHMQELKQFGKRFAAFLQDRPDLTAPSRRIYVGERLRDPNSQRLLLDPSRPLELSLTIDECIHKLSLKEAKCLKRLAAGRTARRIGAELRLSHRTIQNIIAQVKDRLGVHRRDQLVDVVEAHPMIFESVL